jgi:uncharacterized protein
MAALFEVNELDSRIYHEELEGFLPAKMIDIHTHVWLDKFRAKVPEAKRRAVTWPSLVAAENSIEDLQETYRLMFPGKEVTPLIFSSLKRNDDHDGMNRYIAECGARHGVPTLLYAFPEWSAEELLVRILAGRHLGIKVYLNLSPAYIPEAEIRIFDFIPHHQLELLNRHGMMLMLHIPRHGRLGDPVNLAQMLEIEERYPKLRVVYAHIGRAYCPEDFGNAFEVLKKTKHLMIDFSATTQEVAMYKALEAVGPKRILFGSDLPILRMRMRRICEGGRYINIVPKGLYGDVSGDPNMREASAKESGQLSFFMYEELRAFRKAATRIGLDRKQLDQVFYRNAKDLINGTAKNLYGEALLK